MDRRSLALPAALLLVGGLAACGSDDSSDSTAASPEPTTDTTLVVTTNILGDVVGELVGDTATVEVLMPVGADPHDFQLSAQQAASLREADAVIANGADFEEGMLDALEAAEGDGVAIYEAISAVDTLDGGHSHEEGEEHADEEAVDPHFFTDPDRMAAAAAGIVEFLEAEVPALAEADLAGEAAPYLAELEGLGADVDATLEPIPAEARILVTNHEVFGYFADRFAFEVVGVIIPGGGTQGGADAATLAELADTIEAEGVPAIFADVSSSQELADTLAAEAGGDVEVVELFSESLGEEGSGGETYLEMVQTNAQRIADALG